MIALAKKKKADNKPRTRELKPFEELTITDDFMFGAVMSDPKRCKRLLEEILNIKIRRIEYPERQKYIDLKYDAKSIRLDIYVEDEKNTVYDIEMQTTSSGYLPLRMRYYHDLIDLNIINKGQNYKHLKQSFVIFLCTFDPFGKDRYKYLFKHICEDDYDVVLEDKAIPIILNSTGHVGDISDDLKDFLHYMAGQEPKGDFVQDVAKSVDEIRKNETWRRDYMTLAMRIQEENEIVDLSRIILTISKLRGEMSNDRLVDIFNLKEDQLTEILSLLDQYPDKDEWELAEMILYK